MDFEKGLLRRAGLAAAVLGAFLGVALAAASPASAGDAWSSITGAFGGDKPPEDTSGVIDYRPRPALVVPPTNDLPPPQAPGTASPTNAPNWPKPADASALTAARADSRRPAPTADSKIDSGAAQAVYLPDTGPNCNDLAGMPMCFNTPWGQEIDLPGAQKEPGKHGVTLSNAPTRQYLTDPPVTYMQAVQLSAAASENGAVMAAAGGQEQQKCMMPGWFGCPENQGVGQQGAGGQENPGGIDAGLGAAKQKCMFPGSFGCPAEQAGAQTASANDGAVPAASANASAGQDLPTKIAPPASPRPANKCQFPGWFGCPDTQASIDAGSGASTQKCMFPGVFGCPAN